MPKQDKKEYQRQYHRENIQEYRLKINRKTEPEILEWIQKEPSIQGYLKDLILKDMRENKDDNRGIPVRRKRGRPRKTPGKE